MQENGRNLWQRVISFDNLWHAYKKAARGKRGKTAASSFERDLEENLLELHSDLKQGRYVPRAYSNFYIHDPKRRLISAAPFRDRVVHHALTGVIEPFFEKRFIFDTYANRVGKGTHAALDRCTHYLRRFAYVLPLDVRQFFPAIDHAVLITILQKQIKDERVMDLCSRIIHSGQGLLADEYDMLFYPGDDLIAATRPRGLPKVGYTEKDVERRVAKHIVLEALPGVPTKRTDGLRRQA